MNSVSRIFAIVRTDCLIRFRRSSTVVIFLLLCISAYLWIPDPSTGRALLQINERRALYNSAALSIATASLCTILLGWAGFYMISNSLQRDVETRTGFVLASTTVRNTEYLAGKFLGNVVFLSAVIGAFMVSSMVMQLVRGEAPLQPHVFLLHYLLMVPPLVVAVSVLSIVFESIRFLSGRFGDVVYFFLWSFMISIVVVATEIGGMRWASYFDVTGFAFMLERLKTLTHSDSMSIGASAYDVKQAPFVLPVFRLEANWLLPRIVSTVFTMPLLLIALWSFHRFDPVRLKASAQRTRRSLFTRLNRAFSPLTAKLFRFQPGKKNTFTNAVFAELFLNLKLYPLALFAIFGAMVLSLVLPLNSVQKSFLPILSVLICLLLADLSTRERRSGTLNLLFSAPHLKTHYVWWKFSAALLLTLLILLIPALRLLWTNAPAALSIVTGAAFTAAFAVALGVMTGNPKAFVVLFLMFWYLALNDSGRSPGFDFAGWYGIATTSVRLKYFLLTLAALGLSHLFHQLHLKKKY